ncbi:MAG TPA: N-acetyl-gamma-glutamyl-phosphate reductase [Gammaproteobacteria bacterium]|nr:N-acetyl-gamma-glutamyl-phosphate reductase [Gammaproteobacteria bacterium]
MYKVGIVGGTGYTGVELMRLLSTHPRAALTTVTSRGNVGMPVAEMFPSLRGVLDLEFTDPSIEQLADCDVVFFATPHGTAMQSVPQLLERDVRVIDLGPDFRLRDAAEWSQWYKQEHACPELLGEAVYGLPELNREAIRSARLVANPGCYPTCTLLAVMPLLERGLIDTERLIVDAKSGVSGAGRQAQVRTLLCEAGENFSVYGLPGHRHHPEISQQLAQIAGQQVGLVFVPHLLPMSRGMEATVYAGLARSDVELQDVFERRYASETFVDVLPAGSLPDTKSVRGTNICRLAVHRSGDTVIVVSVIDNLTKGASGQAIQNMNLMLGLEETLGLQVTAVLP